MMLLTMRYFSTLFLVFLCCLYGVQAQSASVSLQNPQVVGNELSYDIYIKNTGSTTVRLVDATLYVKYNGSKFSSPTSVSFVSDLPSAGYSPTIEHFASTPKAFSVDIAFNGTPNASNTVQLSSSGNGTKIGTVTMSDITVFTGTADIEWGVSLPLFSRVFWWNQQSGNSENLAPTFVAPPTIYLGAEFTATLLNQKLEGTDYTFDVNVKRTNGQPLYLGNSSFVFTVDASKFSSPTVTVLSRGTTKLTDYYTYATNLQGNTFMLAVTSPTASTQAEFAERVQQILSFGTGTRIATIKISPAATPIAITGIAPQWVTGVSGAVVRSRRNAASWNTADDITANGTFEVEPPDVLLSLLTPNGGQTLCAGATQQITWQSANIQRVKLELVPQGGGSPISVASDVSATTGTYSWVVPALAGSYFLKITDRATAAVNDQSDAVFAIQIPAQLTTQPTPKTACKGDNVVLVSAGNGTPAPTVQWQVSTDGSTWNNVSGGTGASLALNNVQPSLSGNRYRVLYTSACSGVITSNTVTLTVNEPPVFTGQIASHTVCAGEAVTFSIQMAGTPTPTIQWQTSGNGGGNWNTVSGATTTTLVLPAVQASNNGMLVRAVLSNACGQNVLSNNALLTVNTAPTLQQHPQSIAVCSGSTVALSASAIGTPTPAVRWEQSSNGTDWVAIAGETALTLALSNVQVAHSGTRYRAVFSNACGTVTSNAAQLTVGTTVQITAQPQNTTVCEGQDALFPIGVTGTPTPAVRWEQSSNGTDWTTIAGQTTPTLVLPTVQASMTGLKVRAVFSNMCTSSLTSNTVTLTVQTKPVVTTQPQDAVVCVGSTAVFGVQISGTPVPVVQWQVSTTNGVQWQNLSGKTATELRLENLRIEQNNTLYRVVLSNACGTNIASAGARLNLLTPPTIATQPQDVVVCEGNTALLQVEATGIPVPTVQWQSSANNGTVWEDIPQATSAVLSLGNVARTQNGVLYKAVLSNLCGVATSATARLSVNTAPEVAVQPTSTTACLNSTVQFTASATGTPVPRVQWQSSFDGNTWVDIAGAQTPTLVLAAVQITQNQARYRAVFANECGNNVASGTVVLSVRTAPSIRTQPVSRTVVVEQSVQFSVDVEVQGGVQYQWFRGTTTLQDGGRYSGTNTDRLFIADVQPSDVSSEYYVLVTGDCGTVRSDFAALNIEVPGISIASQPNAVGMCQGGNAEFSIVATTDVGGAVLTYQWRRGNTPLTDGGRYSGVHTSTLRIADVTEAEAASNYHVQITVEPGGARTYSNNVALRVDVLPVITGKPASIAVCSGEPAAVEVVATGSAPLSYVWLHNGTEIPGATQARYVIPAVVEETEGRYTCVVANACGSATSQEAHVSVKMATVITEEPQSVPGTLGRKFTLRVVATGTGILSYQWYRNGEPVAGATQSEYSNVALDDASAGVYYCIVQGECNRDTSNTATVSIAVDVQSAASGGTELGQNYPNPAHGTTVIPVVLPSAMAVELVVRDVFGRNIVVLHRGMLEAGRHAFTVQSNTLPSGVYFYTLSGGGHVVTRSMLVAR